MRFPIMATKPKRGLNTLELRLCMFGAARTLWSYARACLAPPKRFGATPVHVRCSTGHKKIQEIMKYRPITTIPYAPKQGGKITRARRDGTQKHTLSGTVHPVLIRSIGFK